MKHKPLPSQERLKELLNYDPQTGIFTWKLSTSARVRVGDVAGTKSVQGYIIISIDNSEYRTNRLAWMYAYGEDPGHLQVDHKNRKRDENNITNLRLATCLQNNLNKVVKGYHWCKQANKWRATIRVDGKKIFLGNFNCPLLAHLTYCDARNKYYGEFTPV